MPKGLKGFQKNHKSFLSKNQYKKIAKKLKERPNLKNRGRSAWNKGKKLTYQVWNKGLKSRYYPISFELKLMSEYKEWRKKVFEKDNYTCQICKIRGGKLECDHYPQMKSEILKQFNIQTTEQAKKSEKLWNINNGRTLCQDCHRMVTRNKVHKDSRAIFIDTLLELAEKDPTIVLIVPDVGFMYVEQFANRFPSRFFNFGVTEQSCIMIATGMALSGLKPYVYSMINFVLFRPYEMIRNGIVHHNANVKLLGVKGSVSYKFLGFSHNLHSENEDVDACHNLKLRSFVPKTNTEVKKIILTTYQDQKSAYIRL